MECTKKNFYFFTYLRSEWYGKPKPKTPMSDEICVLA